MVRGYVRELDAVLDQPAPLNPTVSLSKLRELVRRA
jgi:hypothetical protein